MNYRIFIIFMLFVFSQKTSYSQSKEDIRLMPPFDSISVERHREQINIGASYLILIQSGQSDNAEFYLINTAWYELPGGKNHSFNYIDSLLNGRIPKIEFEKLLPISGELFYFYDQTSTCELLKMVFSNEGYYDEPPYYLSSQLILASLVKRGLMIGVSDYDGFPSFNPSSIDCE